MNKLEANMGPQKSKNQKFSKSKSVLPKLSARFFYAGERRPRPIWGPPGPFFPWAGKIQKLAKFCLFSLVGPWALFTRFGALAAILPRWGYWHPLAVDKRYIAARAPGMLLGARDVFDPWLRWERVRLAHESLSGTGAAGTWKYGNL